VKKSDLERVVDLVERIDMVRRFRTTLDSGGPVSLMSAGSRTSSALLCP
jgi:hypothetical protein